LSLRLLLSCGEASGDLYAGALTRELRTLEPSLQIAGMGGPHFAEAGGDVLVDYRGAAVTGFVDPLRKLPTLIKARRHLVDIARTTRPDALIVIDFSGFNLRLASQIKALGVPIIFYISPQVWAWRSGRIDAIKRLAERVLVIFPFEEDLYRRRGIPVEFVGHPLVDLAHATAPRHAFLSRHHLAPASPTVAVLPGSRAGEVRRILPGLLAATRIIRGRVPGVQFVVARAPRLDDALFGASELREAGTVVVEGDTDTVLAASDVALTASGTATVQAALHDTPMVVVYRLPSVTYRLGLPFVKIDTYAMVNIIAGERLVPELIQEQFTPQAVADEAVSMLTDVARTASIRAGLTAVRARLGGPGASHRAAEAILKIVAVRR
jgi:lipid-A-disaccharide synthase